MFLKTLFRNLTLSVQNLIAGIRFRLKSSTLLQARAQYKYSDEHLKFVHILEAMNYLRVAGAAGRILPQTFFEFGCHSGRTFSAAVNASGFLGMKNARFFAFDSFEGLPPTREDEDGYFQSGTFCTSKQQFVSIVKRIQGKPWQMNRSYRFYSDSLTSEIQERMPKAGVIHIDVDLYSSTVDVLRFAVFIIPVLCSCR